MSQRYYNFIIARAFRYGSVKRGDLQLAFNELRNTKASAVIKDALQKHDGLIMREGNKIVPRPTAKVPKHLNDSDLAEAIINGNDFSQMGIDVPVQYADKIPCIPLTDGALQTIAKQMSLQACVDIGYVGRRLQDRGNTRTVKPIRFEVHGDNIYLIANDLSDKFRKVKTFLVSRILDAKPSIVRATLMPHDDEKKAKKTFFVNINPLATSEQTLVIRHQFGLDSNNKLKLSPRYLTDLKQQVCSKDAYEGVLSPLAIEVRQTES